MAQGGASSWGRSEIFLRRRSTFDFRWLALNGVRPTPLWHHITIAGCNCWVIDLIIYSALKIIKASPQSREWYGRWLCLHAAQSAIIFIIGTRLSSAGFLIRFWEVKNKNALEHTVRLITTCMASRPPIIVVFRRDHLSDFNARLTCQMTQEMLLMQTQQRLKLLYKHLV